MSAQATRPTPVHDAFVDPGGSICWKGGWYVPAERHTAWNPDEYGEPHYAIVWDVNVADLLLIDSMYGPERLMERSEYKLSNGVDVIWMHVQNLWGATRFVVRGKHEPCHRWPAKGSDPLA